ncbi:MAG: hypothetical protein ACYDG6_13325 [Thermincolia bacterium]
MGIRITDIERTMVDSIKNFDKIGGLEELLSCKEMLAFLDNQKLLLYLSLYDLRVLYQRCGYILEHYKVMELYSGKIVGWAMLSSLPSQKRTVEENSPMKNVISIRARTIA